MKSSLFFKNAKLLNQKLSIIPLIYGSSGLEYITGESLDACDIDILIPEVFINDRWNELKKVLDDAGYVLTDEHEHTFKKEGIDYSYASLEELKPFAGISPFELEEKEKEDARFLVLSLEQYKKVYLKSQKDGYRINVRKKKDSEKLSFIEGYLKR